MTVLDILSTITGLVLQGAVILWLFYQQIKGYRKPAPVPERRIDPYSHEALDASLRRYLK